MLDFALLPTPIEPARRLARALDMDDDALWVKRDDLTGVGGGGNKVRKLVHLAADALAQGCDVFVTGGGRQSNHCRTTAAVANRLGVDCVLVMSSDPVEVPSGNVLLDVLFGAALEWVGPVGYHELNAAIDDAAARLRDAGRRPYAMPIGGASPVGERGYVDAAAELQAQVADIELVVTAGGSGGTHAGLAMGFGDHARVLGVDVGARPDLAEFVAAAAVGAAGHVQVDSSQVGEGYAEPTATGREAADLFARCEGLILDPVYTAKAAAGLVAARREGRIERDTRTVFLHTGGLPALFSPRFAEWVVGAAGLEPPPAQR
ncbi:MAG TPA: D-cysteine desulfhydrase family protein [Acidimicrobiales bacterium]|nr:D-cysteine desulfhydrase family protein [Acidimicrobiales bacterium]